MLMSAWSISIYLDEVLLPVLRICRTLNHKDNSDLNWSRKYNTTCALACRMQQELMKMRLAASQGLTVPPSYGSMLHSPFPQRQAAVQQPHSIGAWVSYLHWMAIDTLLYTKGGVHVSLCDEIGSLQGYLRTKKILRARFLPVPNQDRLRMLQQASQIAR